MTLYDPNNYTDIVCLDLDDNSMKSSLRYSMISLDYYGHNPFRVSCFIRSVNDPAPEMCIHEEQRYDIFHVPALS